MIFEKSTIVTAWLGSGVLASVRLFFILLGLSLAVSAIADGPTVPGSRAVLKNGIAYAPSNAPENVKRAIWAANALRKMPYRFGGGHGSFNDCGYDCSGTVSFALHYAGVLASPTDSDGGSRSTRATATRSRSSPACGWTRRARTARKARAGMRTGASRGDLRRVTRRGFEKITRRLDAGREW